MKLEVPMMGDIIYLDCPDGITHEGKIVSTRDRNSSFPSVCILRNEADSDSTFYIRPNYPFNGKWVYDQTIDKYAETNSDFQFTLTVLRKA